MHWLRFWRVRRRTLLEFDINGFVLGHWRIEGLGRSRRGDPRVELVDERAHQHERRDAARVGELQQLLRCVANVGIVSARSSAA